MEKIFNSFKPFSKNYVYHIVKDNDIEILDIKFLDEEKKKVIITYSLPIYIVDKSIMDEGRYKFYKRDIIDLPLKLRSRKFYVSNSNSDIDTYDDISKRYGIDIHDIKLNVAQPTPHELLEYDAFLFNYITFSGSNVLQKIRKRKIKNILEDV